jgi:hypothetical protein
VFGAPALRELFLDAANPDTYDFDPEKHPRDDKGRFGPGDGVDTEPRNAGEAARWEDAQGWEQTEPWLRSQEDFEMDRVASFTWSPGLRNEASNVTSTIKIGPKFFDLPPAAARAVMYHELGHDIGDRMVGNGDALRLQDEGYMPGGEHVDLHDLNGQTQMDEVISEAYSVLNDEPAFLYEHASVLADAVHGMAEQLGLPLTREAQTAAGDWNEDAHPRDAKGRFGDKADAPETAKGWHLTDNPGFVPDPHFVPENNSTYLDRILTEEMPPGIYTGDPE